MRLSGYAGYSTYESSVSKLTINQVDVAVAYLWQQFSILWASAINTELGLAGKVNFSGIEGAAERYFEVSSSLAFGIAFTDVFGGYLEY